MFKYFFNNIGVPSSAQRSDILHTILSGMRHTLSDSQIEQLAMSTHGFVGADLSALCCEAAFVCLRRHLDQRTSSSNFPLEEVPFAESSTNMSDLSSDSSDSASSCITVSPTTSGAQRPFSSNGTVSLVADDIQNDGNSCSEQLNTLSVGFEDFENAKTKIRPSAMREVCPFLFFLPRKLSWLYDELFQTLRIIVPLILTHFL